MRTEVHANTFIPFATHASLYGTVSHTWEFPALGHRILLGLELPAGWL